LNEINGDGEHKRRQAKRDESDGLTTAPLRQI